MPAELVDPQLLGAVAPPGRRPFLLPALNVTGVLGFLFALCVSTTWLYTRNNNHPFWYHPDENTKAAQVMDPSGERNFHHPQLLLEAADIWTRWRNTPRDMQRICEAGRDVSAFFGAMCCVGLALAGYIGFGWRGMVLVGAATQLCPSLLVYSHDFKEDASLLVGVGLVVGASALYWRYQSPAMRWFTLPLLGAAAAIAPSGKYIGVVSLAMALPVLFLAPGIRWWSMPLRLAVFAVFCVGTWALINYRVFQQSEHFWEGFGYEREHVDVGHNGLTMDKPNKFIAYCLKVETRWHVKTFAAAFVGMLGVGWFMRGRIWWREQGWQLLALLFGVTWFVVLSHGTGPFHRYALPVIVLAHFCAGMGAAAVTHNLTRTWQQLSVATALASLFVAMQGPICTDMNRQFADDGRSHLREWLATKAEPGAVLSADRYTLLWNPPDPRVPYGQKPFRVRLLGDAMNAVGGVGGYGSVDLLRMQGVRYVAVASSSYERFMLPFIKGQPGREPALADRRDFYGTLFAHADWIAWEWPVKHPTYAFINPTLTVYKLPPMTAEERRRFRPNRPPQPQERKGFFERLFGG